MPIINANNVELFYEERGAGKETIVFSHGFLMTHEMFQAQIESLQGQFRCIAYDHRGHGRSQATMNGYDTENLYRDAAVFVEALDCGPCHFVGMSTGGFVGLQLAIQRPELLKSLVLVDTSAEPETKADFFQYTMLLYTFRYLGWRPVIGQAMSKLYGPKYLNDPAKRPELKKWRRIMTSHDRTALYKFGKGIFSRKSVVDQLNQISIPTTVIVGEQDVPTPLVRSQNMAAQIPNANLHIIPNSGHTTPLEAPEAVTAILQQFYQSLKEA